MTADVVNDNKKNARIVRCTKCRSRILSPEMAELVEKEVMVCCVFLSPSSPSRPLCRTCGALRVCPLTGCKWPMVVPMPQPGQLEKQTACSLSATLSRYIYSTSLSLLGGYLSYAAHPLADNPPCIWPSYIWSLLHCGPRTPTNYSPCHYGCFALNRGHGGVERAAPLPSTWLGLTRLCP